MNRSKLTTQEIIKLYEGGMSIHDISPLAEISEAAIWKRLRVAGYKTKNIHKGVRWRKNESQEEYLGSDGRYWVRHYYKDGRNKRSERRYIVVMEKYLGFSIPQGMVVHHIDGDPTNDDISNLALMTKEAHNTIHHKGKGKRRR